METVNNSRQILTGFILLFANCFNTALAQPVDFGFFPPVAEVPQVVTTQPAPLEELSREDVENFLRSLLPENRDRESLAKLVRELSSSNFDVREQATKSLMNLPMPPVDLLSEAAASDDAEKSWRATAVLRSHRDRHRQTLHHALNTIRREKFEGLTRLLISAAPYMEVSEDGSPLRNPVEVSTIESDREYLLEFLNSDHPSLRVLAVLGLAKIQSENDRELFVKILEDKNEFVRLETARSVALQADPVVLPTLVKLLSSEKANIRSQSVSILRAITGKKFGFVAYDQPANRNASIEEWSKWITDNADSVKLEKWTGKRQCDLMGITAICHFSENRVVILDDKWKELRTFEGLGPWDVVVYENGEVLIVWYNSKKVSKYDAAGRELWTYQASASPWVAQALENDNILINDGPKVVELNQFGKVVDSNDFETQVFYAVRTELGGIVAVLQNNKVIEVDADGKALWQVEGLSMPYHVQRLESGNSLVVERGKNRIIEFEQHTGKIVSEKAGLHSPDSCQKLPNGNLLICEANVVREYSPEGKIIFELKAGSSQNKARRF